VGSTKIESHAARTRYPSGGSLSFRLGEAWGEEARRARPAAEQLSRYQLQSRRRHGRLADIVWLLQEWV